MGVRELMRKKSWKLIETTDEWKKENLLVIMNRMRGWQLDTFKESYSYKIKEGISLFKKKIIEKKD